MSMTSESERDSRLVAGEWDSPGAAYLDESVREAAIGRAYLRRDMVVAAVGNVTGLTAVRLVSHAARVHVVDSSLTTLERARRNLAGCRNVEFHLADAGTMPLSEGSMDAVLATMYLSRCRDPLQAVRSMARVLRPGGRLVITDWDAHPRHGPPTEMGDRWSGFAPDQMRAWLRQTDLVNVIVTRLHQPGRAESASSDVSDAHPTATPFPILLAIGTRRIPMRAAVQASYAAAAQSNCGCDGEMAAPTDCCGAISLDTGCCNSTITLAESDSVTFATGYSDEERDAVPREAETIALGCGNPVAMAGLQAGEVVLDIGSGGGMDAFLAARQVGPTGKVIGVDMTETMLERATRAAEQAGFTNVEFRRGHAEQLPLADSSVDVILSNCVINLCEDKGAAFAEAYRVLKPGGRLEISDVVTGGALPSSLRTDAAAWAGCVAGALPEREYLDLVEQAGFTEVTARRSTSSGSVGGVPVYSLIVSARKGPD